MPAPKMQKGTMRFCSILCRSIRFGSKSRATNGTTKPQSATQGDSFAGTLVVLQNLMVKGFARLWDDSKPGVYRDVREALFQGSLHVRGTAVVEPEREQAQDVLEMSSLPHLSCSNASMYAATIMWNDRFSHVNHHKAIFGHVQVM